MRFGFPLFTAVALWANAAQVGPWPDLMLPAREVGGGERDAAVIVAIENYTYLQDIPGAKANAVAWYDYFTRTRKLRPENIAILTDNDATKEEIEAAVVKIASSKDTFDNLWVIFIGHGAPGKDSRDGVFVGVDAQMKPTSILQRSYSRLKLLEALTYSKGKSIAIILDTCFSGKSSTGEPLLPGLQPLIVATEPKVSNSRFVVLSAAQSDQFAGPLPELDRPAFSYLMLGSLRGWADANGDKRVALTEAFQFTSKTLGALRIGRRQEPQLIGDGGRMSVMSPSEDPPDLSALVRHSALGDDPDGHLKRPTTLSSSFINRLLEKVDAKARQHFLTLIFDENKFGSGSEKAKRWFKLASQWPQFSDFATERSAAWDEFEKLRFRNRIRRSHDRMRAKSEGYALVTRLKSGGVPESVILQEIDRFTQRYPSDQDRRALKSAYPLIPLSGNSDRLYSDLAHDALIHSRYSWAEKFSMRALELSKTNRPALLVAANLLDRDMETKKSELAASMAGDVTGSTQTLFLSSRLKHLRGKEADALSDVNRALALVPWDERNRGLKAAITSSQGVYSSEVETGNLENGLNDLELAFTLASEEAIKKNYDKAEKIISSVVDTLSGDSTALEYRAMVYQRFPTSRDATSKALKDIDAAIALTPQEAGLYTLKGNLLSAAGDYREAMQEFQEAQILDMGDQHNYFSFGWAHEQQGDLSKAIKFYSAAASDSDDSNHYAALGRALIRTGRVSESIAPFNRAIQLSPGDAKYYGARAFAKTELKQLDEAKTDYERGLELAPNEAPLHDGLCALLLAVEDVAGALRHCDRAIELASNSQFHLNRAMVFIFGKRDLKSATDDLSRAIEIGPATARMYQIRGDCLHDLGRRREAESDYAKVKELEARGPSK